MTGQQVRATCSVCARSADHGIDGDPPLGWSVEHVDCGRGTRWICPLCTRDNVRAIEAKLDQQWW